MKPNLQAIESPRKTGLHNSESNLRNIISTARADHLPQRVRRTEAAVLRPNTIMTAPTRANSVQAGASAETERAANNDLNDGRADQGHRGQSLSGPAIDYE
jgi:hypothetical protein